MTYQALFVLIKDVIWNCDQEEADSTAYTESSIYNVRAIFSESAIAQIKALSLLSSEAYWLVLVGEQSNRNHKSSHRNISLPQMCI